MSRSASKLPARSRHSEQWSLDPDIVFLNHGSFGACPTKVLQAQSELRHRMETEPVRFFIRELPDLLDQARSRLAAFVGADDEGLAFVNNATTGVNTALASIPIDKGDEILVTDHGYPACRNAADVRARATGARVVEAAIPFPLSSAKTITETVLDAVSPRTRVAIVDHVTSPTGLVFPVTDLARELAGRDVVVIVDGAHAPGMLELDIEKIGAPFFTGNCHKWLCAPKGAAFIWAREDWRRRTRPLVTSHGATAPLGDRSRFHLEFDWTGTGDPTPWLSVPAAIDVVGSMLPGGWEAVRCRNRKVVLEVRLEICAALGLDPPCPDSMIGSLATVPLPPGIKPEPVPSNGVGQLQDLLYTNFAIEVPVTVWASPVRNGLRISAHLYNHLEDYRYLIAALEETGSELPLLPLRD